MAGQFKIKLNHEANSMMEALGIDPERCEELCNIIDETGNKHKDWSLGQILEEASTHCENFNEALFMFHVFGEHLGAFKYSVLGKLKSMVMQHGFEHAN